MENDKPMWRIIMEQSANAVTVQALEYIEQLEEQIEELRKRLRELD